ncbi:IS200/IS605 family transposase [Botrimarina sp.]|uniref:IS200/IS605 family transposase n=1 Tax=Botrimarina sp. TaxID=2795802 RepID=UPI0032F071EA
MPSTYSCLSYHIVFTTKRRARYLSPEIRPRVYEYLGGVVRAEGGSLTEIGGVEDHVHLLVKLKPTQSLADFVRTLKANSSKWINENRLVSSRFEWQEGYGAFTVSESQTSAVSRYLQRQAEHHARTTFAEEVSRLCERHGVTPPTESPGRGGSA